jgi:hypothetical protein
VHDEVFGRARRHRRPFADVEGTAALDGALLEGHRAERDVHRRRVAGNEQQGPVPERKVSRVRESPAKRAQEGVDEAFLAAESRHEREIDVCGHARLAASLDGEPADEADENAAARQVVSTSCAGGCRCAS